MRRRRRRRWQSCWRQRHRVERRGVVAVDGRRCERRGRRHHRGAGSDGLRERRQRHAPGWLRVGSRRGQREGGSVVGVGGRRRVAFAAQRRVQRLGLGPRERRVRRLALQRLGQRLSGQRRRCDWVRWRVYSQRRRIDGAGGQCRPAAGASFTTSGGSGGSGGERRRGRQRHGRGVGRGEGRRGVASKRVGTDGSGGVVVKSADSNHRVAASQKNGARTGGVLLASGHSASGRPGRVTLRAGSSSRRRRRRRGEGARARRRRRGRRRRAAAAPCECRRATAPSAAAATWSVRAAAASTGPSRASRTSTAPSFCAPLLPW